VAVPANLMFELSWHPDTVSHPYASCKLHVPVAALRMHLEFHICKLEKSEYALICHVLGPVFLFFAHGGVIAGRLQISMGKIIDAFIFL